MKSDNYREIIQRFSELTIKEKHEEIIENIEEVLMIFHSLCKKRDSNAEILTDKKMKNLSNCNLSDEEFLNGIYAYILSMKESIGLYFQLYNNL